MKKDFRNDFRDEVKANTDIAQIIERYSTLDSDGETKWKKGDCPICGEGTILVEPEAQIFKTICCKHQGDCFTFIEVMTNKSYTEALIHLAEEAKMQIPKRIKTNGHSAMNDKPQRRMFGFFKRSIPYFKDLRKLTGSVTASILMSQLEYWFEDKPMGFFKFLEAPPEGHPVYKPGDSWCEELAFSKEEFRGAFDRIGIRYPSKTQFFSADPNRIFIASDGKEMFYANYFDKVRGTTHYFRNPKTDTLLDELLKNVGDKKTQSPEIKRRKKQKA